MKCPPFDSLAFGSSSRVCLGRQLADYEGRLVLAKAGGPEVSAAAPVGGVGNGGDKSHGGTPVFYFFFKPWFFIRG